MVHMNYTNPQNDITGKTLTRTRTLTLTLTLP